jgi:hypothetical protein
MSLLREFPNTRTIRLSLRAFFKNTRKGYLKSFAKEFVPSVGLAGTSADPSIYAQAATGELLRHIGLPAGDVIVGFRSDISEPGRIELSKGSDAFVELQSPYKFDRDAMVAILSHEVTHVLLRELGIALPSVEENEILTDVAAALVGFGTMILNSSTFGNSQLSRRVHFGYLTLEEFGLILAKRSAYLGLDIESLLRDGPAKASYRAGRERLSDELGSSPILGKGSARDSGTQLSTRLRNLVFSAKESIEFDCPVCTQGLRLPTKKGNMVTTCPVCAFEMKCIT